MTTNETTARDTAWYIVDADDFDLDAEDMYATARVHYGPFKTKAEAEAFAAEPGNKWFDEAHGPIVERPVHAELSPRERLLREYLIRIATKIGHRDTLTLDNGHDIERVGEAVMAELERREDATELNVHGARLSENVERERYQQMWGRPLSDHDQAQLDALRVRMEAETDGRTR